jgi:hypothetical protein
VKLNGSLDSELRWLSATTRVLPCAVHRQIFGERLEGTTVTDRKLSSRVLELGASGLVNFENIWSKRNMGISWDLSYQAYFIV